MKSNFQSYQSAITPFAFGGISGCVAAAIIMPLDTWKVRIQVCSEDLGMRQINGICEHPLSILLHVYDNDGIKGFYKGLGSSILRQITYTTTRLGLYKSMKNHIKMKHKRDLTFFEKVYSSSISGLIGALVGNPADICLIRFQSDTSLAVEERRNYKNAFDALKRIVKDEGILALWKGSQPTILRAVVVTVGQLTTYEELKELFIRYNQSTKETNFDRVISSIGAGIVTSVFSLPFDHIKTKLQKMKMNHYGVYPYSGMFDCLVKSIQRESFKGLWVGLPVYFARLAPQSMIILVVQDILHNEFSNY